MESLSNEVLFPESKACLAFMDATPLVFVYIFLYYFKSLQAKE